MKFKCENCGYEWIEDIMNYSQKVRCLKCKSECCLKVGYGTNIDEIENKEEK